jgi:hypothetical protein
MLNHNHQLYIIPQPVNKSHSIIQGIISGLMQLTGPLKQRNAPHNQLPYQTALCGTIAESMPCVDLYESVHETTSKIPPS